MTTTTTIRGVTLGDTFRRGLGPIQRVVDFREVRSVTTGELIAQVVVARSTGLATNLYECPFATVLRNRCDELLTA